MPKVYIIIVNWNGWGDTIECLESIFRLSYSNYSVIVCDNASADSSLDHIATWAEGKLLAKCANPALQSYTAPPVPKPVLFARVDAVDSKCLRNRPERLFLVQTGSNLGFAAGNNVGLRLALGAGDLAYVWLLNNDTVVDRLALTELIATIQLRADVGICGSTLVYYKSPNTIQALGGSIYNRWTARGGHIGAGQDLEASQKIHGAEVESRMKYVVGASMLVSSAVFEAVGLLDESYFLYFEELDLAVRARAQFKLAYAPASIVFHKEGASIGRARTTVRQSLASEYYGTRNRILFTYRFYRWALPSVAVCIVASVIHRLIHGRMGHALMICRACADIIWVLSGPTVQNCIVIRQPVGGRPEC